jgi:Ca-activated chloride channel family protein
MTRKRTTEINCTALFAIGVAFLLTAVPAPAEGVKLDVSLGTPTMLADKKDTAYLKVGLTGFEMGGESKRTPVNVGIVLDRSGSMQGEKIRKAKEAAAMAVNRLNQDDILSIVAYDDTVSVLLPATKVADKTEVRAAIGKIEAGDSTALFAGVSKGANEVRKFLDENRVNRVILLSDGLANVGPSSPSELGDLGASLIKEGISVTTIGLGLGFNEDLMTQLAMKSDGNHAFVENAADLTKIFDQEFGDVLSVVAQEITIRIECMGGIRPVRVLGREADISGQMVIASLNQLYSNQEKYVILEVEVPAGSAGSSLDVAQVEVTYANMATKSTDHLSNRAQVRFTDSPTVVDSETNKEVMVPVVRQIANQTNQAAVVLRDRGQVEEARQMLLGNSSMLSEFGQKYSAPVLLEDKAENEMDAGNLDSASWNSRRKEMRGRQHKVQTQQKY